MGKYFAIVNFIVKYKAPIIALIIFLTLLIINWYIAGDTRTALGRLTGQGVLFLCISSSLFCFIPAKKIPINKINFEKLKTSTMWLMITFVCLFALGYLLYLIFHISPSNYSSIRHSLSNVIFDVGTGCSAVCAGFYKLIYCYLQSKNREDR